MTYFISDTHWGHENILKYDNRPFKTIEEHDEFHVQEWNKIVRENDDVWHLGDVTFSAKHLDRILPRLNGRIHLIRGNHDDKAAWKNRYRFYAFHESLYTKIAGVGFHLSHYPLQDWRNMRRGTIHLHGHVHGNLDSYIQGRLDVSSNMIGYKPISLEEVLAAVEEDVVEWHTSRRTCGDGEFYTRA